MMTMTKMNMVVVVVELLLLLMMILMIMMTTEVMLELELLPLLLLLVTIKLLLKSECAAYFSAELFCDAKLMNYNNSETTVYGFNPALFWVLSGFVLMSCKVNFYVVRSALQEFCLQNLICLPVAATADDDDSDNNDESDSNGDSGGDDNDDDSDDSEVLEHDEGVSVLLLLNNLPGFEESRVSWFYPSLELASNPSASLRRPVHVRNISFKLFLSILQGVFIQRHLNSIYNDVFGYRSTKRNGH